MMLGQSSISNDQFVNAIKDVFDLIGVIDLKGRVIEMNGSIFSRTGIDPRLIAGQIFSETVFWQSTKSTSLLLTDAIAAAAEGKSVDMTLDFRISAEEKVAFDLQLRRISNEKEEDVIVATGKIADRTGGEFGSIKRESQQLLLAAENAEIGLWYWDFHGGRIYSTPQCNELFGLPAYQSLTYQAFISSVHPDDRRLVTDFIEVSKAEGSRYEGEFRVVYPAGDVEWVCVEGKSFLDRNGQPLKMMGVVRKVTEQKIAAEELAKIYDREKKARDEAVEANRSKDFFLAFVSHELRAPLNAILGWSRILLTKEVDEETRKNALETIERSARVQTKLINDLVDSARVASGKLRLEYRPTDLYALVRGSFQAHKPAAEAKGIDLQFSADREDIAIFGDVNRLQQVFGNLISNAIKFTPEGGRITVSITTTDSTAAIAIEDNGQGINPESIPLIFRQFSQGDADQTRVSSGLGLGLSIAKILAERHGGTITVTSQGIGHGSTFIVKLPLGNSEASLQNSFPRIPTGNLKPLTGIKVMIVEDDADSREVLQLFLEQSGASVISATNARSAIKLLSEMNGNLPDSIISDLAMPEEDGYSMIKKIRGLSENEGGKIPALALSAFATSESRDKAFEAGFQSYSTKPFEPDILVREVLKLQKTSGSDQ